MICINRQMKNYESISQKEFEALSKTEKLEHRAIKRYVQSNNDLYDDLSFDEKELFLLDNKSYKKIELKDCYAKAVERMKRLDEEGTFFAGTGIYDVSVYKCRSKDTLAHKALQTYVMS